MSLTFKRISNLVRCKTEYQLAIKTGLAASISLSLGAAFANIWDRPDILVSGLWSVLAAIVVMETNIGGTYYSAWTRFLGVVIGSIAGAIFIHIIGSGALSLGVSVTCTVILCALLNLNESFRIAALSTAVIIVMGNRHPSVEPGLFSFYRFLDSCIGIIVALAVARFVWPAKAAEDIKQNMAKILNILGRYYLVGASFEKEKVTLPKTAEAYLAEINDLLQENRENKKAGELELELSGEPLKIEQWVLLSNLVETVLESVNAIAEVDKETLSKIFDDSLASSVEDLIDKTNIALQMVEKMVLIDNFAGTFDSLKNSMDNVAKELLRFRETRKTRKFTLEDVENFYFYFYHLRAIGETILKTRNTDE